MQEQTLERRLQWLVLIVILTTGNHMRDWPFRTCGKVTSIALIGWEDSPGTGAPFPIWDSGV